MNLTGFRWLQVLLMLAIFTAGRTAFAEQATEDIPSLEMLEFLADWETSDGQWIDPAVLQQHELQQDESKQPTVDKYDES